MRNYLENVGAPAGIRTPDTLLKRQVLCRLSYWGELDFLRRRKNGRGGRTRTCEWRSQSPMCYHFTTPLYGEVKRDWDIPNPVSCGVGYGARTHDTRNHNPVLYQLS